MDLAKYMPNGASALTLATMDATELGKILIYAFDVETRKRTREYQARPRANTEEIRKDIRHKLGEVDGLAFLEELRTAAADHVSGKRSRNTEERDT